MMNWAGQNSIECPCSTSFKLVIGKEFYTCILRSKVYFINIQIRVLYFTISHLTIFSPLQLVRSLDWSAVSPMWPSSRPRLPLSNAASSWAPIKPRSCGLRMPASCTQAGSTRCCTGTTRHPSSSKTQRQMTQEATDVRWLTSWEEWIPLALSLSIVSVWEWIKVLWSNTVTRISVCSKKFDMA